MTLPYENATSGEKAPVPDALTARAFQIADEAMEELLCSHTRQVDVYDPALRALSDGDAHEVERLADADPAIIEAFEWLQARGRAELVPGKDGECILLKEVGNG